nr:hypothetical protein [Pandoravirus aubagnensis]
MTEATARTLSKVVKNNQSIPKAPMRMRLFFAVFVSGQKDSARYVYYLQNMWACGILPRSARGLLSWTRLGRAIDFFMIFFCLFFRARKLRYLRESRSSFAPPPEDTAGPSKSAAGMQMKIHFYS